MVKGWKGGSISCTKTGEKSVIEWSWSSHGPPVSTQRSCCARAETTKSLCRDCAEFVPRWNSVRAVWRQCTAGAVPEQCSVGHSLVQCSVSVDMIRSVIGGGPVLVQ